MHRVVLYTRAGCHLCEVAREVLDDVMATDPFELAEVDIDSADELVRDYGFRVPVVEVDGVEVFETEVDAGELRALLQAPVREVSR